MTTAQYAVLISHRIFKSKVAAYRKTDFSFSRQSLYIYIQDMNILQMVKLNTAIWQFLVVKDLIRFSRDSLCGARPCGAFIDSFRSCLRRINKQVYRHSGVSFSQKNWTSESLQARMNGVTNFHVSDFVTWITCCKKKIVSRNYWWLTIIQKD